MEIPAQTGPSWAYLRDRWASPADLDWTRPQYRVRSYRQSGIRAEIRQAAAALAPDD